MKPLRENILARMSPEARRGIGQQTAVEAEESFVARSERELQDQLCALLHRSGVRFVHRSRMDKKTTANVGTPDLLFAAIIKEVWATRGEVVRTIPCAWEVKLPGRKPTDKQLQVHADMQADGWEVAIIHDYAEARAELARLGVTTD